MAQKVFGSLSMVQLSLRLQRVAKTKQWELFQRVMLVIVLIIWVTIVMASVFFHLTSGMWEFSLQPHLYNELGSNYSSKGKSYSHSDSEIGATFTGASATTGPFSPHVRKLAWYFLRYKFNSPRQYYERKQCWLETTYQYS